MKPKHFLSQLDHDKIVAAIAAAEEKTSGEIRVYVSHRDVDDPLPAAIRRFEKFGMHRKKFRNGALIYLAPKSRRLAVVGDEALHEKCGDDFWQEVTALISRHLKESSPTAAIVFGVEKIGEALARHFPADGEENEVPPDSVEEDIY